MLHDHELNTIKHVAHNLYKLKDVAPTALDKAAHGAPQQLLSAAKTSSVVNRVAGLGRLSAGAKMAMKPFVKRVFTIFATNAAFLRNKS